METSIRPARPKNRFELARRFFPDLGQPGGAGDVAAAIELNTRACEVVLLDFIKKHDELFDELGPGVLVVNLTLIDEEQIRYVTLEGWEQDRQRAKDLQDKPFEEFFEKVIRMVRANEDRSGVLMLLIDRSSQRLLNLPRDMPAEQIRDIQAQLATGSKGLILLNRPGHVKPEGFKAKEAK